MSAEDLFRFRCEDLPADTRLLAFRGEEQLCRPYQLEVWFQTIDAPDFDGADAIGSAAMLRAESNMVGTTGTATCSQVAPTTSRRPSTRRKPARP